MKFLHAMRMFAFIFLVAGILFSGCLCRDKNRYYNDEKGFSLIIPGEWNKGTAQGGADLIILPPVNESLIPFRANLTVVVRDQKEDMTLGEYQTRTLEEIKSVLPGFQLLSSGEEKIAGIKSAMVHFTNTLGTVKVQVVQYTLLRKKKSISITFSAMPEDFTRFREGAEKTARSVDLL